jgi:hypothetical protein
VREKASNEGQAVLQRRLREPSFYGEVMAKLAFEPLRLCLVTVPPRARSDRSLPEHLQQIT